TPPGDWIRADLADPVAAAAALSAGLAGIDPAGVAALIVLHNAATLEYVFTSPSLTRPAPNIPAGPAHQEARTATR
ncbi:MAG: hypothetical protein RJA10_700, partial [Pseudomonadota bacterium]